MPEDYSTPPRRAAEAALATLRLETITQECSFSDSVTALADRLTELILADASLKDLRHRVARVLRG